MSYLNNNPDSKVLAVIGSRGITPEGTKKLIDFLEKNKANIKYIVSGGCKNSADEVAHEWAKKSGFLMCIYYPKWHDENGNFIKSAGFVRNRAIIEAASVVLSVYDQVSKGTAHGMQMARDMGKRLIVINFEKAPPQPKFKDLLDKEECPI